MDIALFALLLRLVQDKQRTAVYQDIPIDPGLVGARPPSGYVKPKPIKKVDDTQVRPRGRFGL